MTENQAFYGTLTMVVVFMIFLVYIMFTGQNKNNQYIHNRDALRQVLYEECIEQSEPRYECINKIYNDKIDLRNFIKENK